MMRPNRRADFADRVGKIYEIRYRIFPLKFLVKVHQQHPRQVDAVFFYSLGGYLVFTASWISARWWR